MSLPARTAVVGGGRMGSGIAHALLLAGSDVVLVETAAPAADVRARVVAALQASASRGTLTVPVEDAAARLTVTADVADVAGAGLVVEAVPEDLALKTAVFTAVEAVVAPDAVLASNTSSLPVSQVAAACRHPERVLGLHFFNPVPASLLVEVVVGEASDPAVVERATGWVGELGKTAVVVRDSPGFASSRLGLVLGLEAIRMVEEGVASATDVDAAMVLGYKHPIGPLALTDLVGLDVRLGIARHLHARLGERFAPPALLVDLVARGHLGRKTGQGFFTYSG